MNDFPKSVTINLVNKPALAAMLQALVIAHETRRTQQEAQHKAYLEQEAKLEALPSDERQSACLQLQINGQYVHAFPPLLPKMTLDELATELLELGVAAHLRHGGGAGHHGGHAGVPGVPLGACG